MISQIDFERSDRNEIGGDGVKIGSGTRILTFPGRPDPVDRPGLGIEVDESGLDLIERLEL